MFFFGIELAVPLVVGILLVLMLLAFAFEIRPPEVTAICAVGILLVLGILSADDILSTMSNPAPLTIASMFIISAALVRTGTLETFASWVSRYAKHSPAIACGMLLLFVTLMSGFTNNTPLVMMMIPIGIALAKQMGEPSSRLLMPISFAAILGGTCTLIGTSTNILVDGVAQKSGLAPFTIFEIAPVGMIVALIGLIYLMLTRHLLPDRQTVSSLITGNEEKRFVLSVFIEKASPLIQSNPLKVSMLNSSGRRLIDVIRDGLSLRRELSSCLLQEGDILVMRTTATDVMTMKERGRLTITRPDNKSDDPHLLAVSSRASILVEALMLPEARILGQTLADLRLRRRYGVYPIALHRRGANLAERFEMTPLQVGDTVLLEGTSEDLQKFVETENLMNITEPQSRGYRRQKAPIALAVMIGVITAAAFNLMPLVSLALLGVAIVLATRCVEADEAFAAVDWRLLALILAMLSIGTALEKAGLVEVMVDAVTPTLAGFPPLVALATIYLLSLTLTELVTNNAVAIVVTPIAINLALSLGVDPRPFVIAVIFAASASFLTPIGYQTNTLVYAAGGYRFLDFARYGLPLTVVVAITTLIVIPIIWPL